MTVHTDSFSQLFNQFSGQVRYPTGEERYRAMLAVCAAAQGRDDARHLLEMLGLVEQEES